jgi:deoxyribose-phosphate aldolase
MNVETIVRKVNAILDEANVQARTGRTLPGLGTLPPGESIARVIDHTLLKPEATERDIELLCYEGKLYGFAAVCVNSVFVPLAAELLRETSVKVCTTVGFPLGASLPQVKAYEAARGSAEGAQPCGRL